MFCELGTYSVKFEWMEMCSLLTRAPVAIIHVLTIDCCALNLPMCASPLPPPSSSSLLPVALRNIARNTHSFLFHSFHTGCVCQKLKECDSGVKGSSVKE